MINFFQSLWQNLGPFKAEIHQTVSHRIIYQSWSLNLFDRLDLEDLYQLRALTVSMASYHFHHFFGSILPFRFDIHHDIISWAKITPKLSLPTAVPNPRLRRSGRPPPTAGVKLRWTKHPHGNHVCGQGKRDANDLFLEITLIWGSRHWNLGSIHSKTEPAPRETSATQPELQLRDWAPPTFGVKFLASPTQD